MINITSKICVLLFMAVSFLVNASPFNSNDTLQLLEVKGKISKKDKANGVYKVQLINGDIVLETRILNDENSFVFTLPNNKSYSIKVIKDGYAAKTVYVNAGDLKAQSSNGLFRYEFVVNMEFSGEQSNLGIFTSTPSNETKINKNIPEFNWHRKYCRKVTPLP